MLEQARAHFDRVLVHTDPRVIPFELDVPPRPRARRRVWSRRATWSSRPRHRPRRAGARCWSRPAAAGSAPLCSRPRSQARGRTRPARAPVAPDRGRQSSRRGVREAGREPTGGCRSGAPARRFSGAAGKQPSLRLTSRLQHCRRGAAFPKADGPGTVRDGDGNGTTNASGASGEAWPRRSRSGERADAAAPGRRDRPGLPAPCGTDGRLWRWTAATRTARLVAGCAAAPAPEAAARPEVAG